jgi:mono/diheme cytochrome c family protein
MTSFIRFRCYGLLFLFLIGPIDGPPFFRTFLRPQSRAGIQYPTLPVWVGPSSQLISSRFGLTFGAPIMRRFFSKLYLCAASALALSPLHAAPLPEPASRQVDFVKDIKPLFEASCVKCHAKGKTKGEFSLETRAAFLKGGETEAGAVIGKSAESYVVELVAAVDPDNVMPKKGSRWTAEQVGLLRAWIDQGAVWPDGITFARPEPQNLVPRTVKLPKSAEAHPLDKLLAAYAAEHDVTLTGPVDDRTFARRAYLDAVGLPPSPEQLRDFVFDPSPEKRAKLVRRLLAEHRSYADHWLTFWNDHLRNDYKGTGFIDGGRRQITGWLYQSLVTNKPYDQFVSELVSPRDETSEPFTRGIIWRGVVNASMLPPMQAAQNISQVLLGVNLKCASCHDSFINDWSLADAYGVAAIYSDDQLELVHCDKPTGKIAAPRSLYPQLGALDAKLDRATRMARFADILTGKQNGRLARTVVNRLWARLLGRGLVEPLDDMDRAAWDPAIVDFLAEDLVAHRYDLKRTIELILTSRAYQLPAVESPKDDKEEYVFRGPLTRRLTAEQFSDAIASLTNDWARMPSTIDIDFTAGGIVSEPKLPKWIWTSEPHEDGEFRRAEAVAVKALAPPPPPKKDKRPDGNPADALKHRVVFRKTFTLDEVPTDAQAILAASQGAGVYINGKRPKTAVGDNTRANRLVLFDIAKELKAGPNTIAIEVNSHTDKGPLNDDEKAQFPQSLNHLNSTAGVAFYARITTCCDVMELITDESWKARRAPASGFDAPDVDEWNWIAATPLPKGVAPIDEGPALPPVRRKDYANEKIELGPRLRMAVATANFPGKARASLRASDALMTALDRPTREQVATSRLTAATTLQVLELTNGSTLDVKLKHAGKQLVGDAARDARAWLDRTYTLLISRPPTDHERNTALEFLGDEPTSERVTDLLWSLAMLPEFQLIN